MRRHEQVAQDCWRLIRALGSPEIGIPTTPEGEALKAATLNNPEDFDTAAMMLIEMACDASADVERMRQEALADRIVDKLTWTTEELDAAEKERE